MCSCRIPQPVVFIMFQHKWTQSECGRNNTINICIYICKNITKVKYIIRNNNMVAGMD